MKESTLMIQIDRPVEEVYEFTVNPKNTPKWLDAITEERTNDWPIKLGTVYENQRQDGEWSRYAVVEHKLNELFTLAKEDDTYHVRYAYTPISDSVTELEYHEWVEEGELEPLTQDVLNKLKRVMEAS